MLDIQQLIIRKTKHYRQHLTLQIFHCGTYIYILYVCVCFCLHIISFFIKSKFSSLDISLTVENNIKVYPQGPRTPDDLSQLFGFFFR